ncbi:AraC family transcriptional regulator [Pedobacter psychrodurus]|uniref:AraC family transcriptional regulator n=1 Tax=Pedobacter psychrodurus TaxID=2530456 RepID=UPI00292F09E7|nr:AraC family transcriptional regulator [Pedobacter psychrodurus]
MRSELINVNHSGNKSVHIKHIDNNRLISSFHFHDMCELVWIERSHGKRIVGDHIGNFEDDDLVLMGPNLPHIWQNDKIYEDSDDKAVKSTVVYFSIDFFSLLTDDQDVLALAADLVSRASRGLVFDPETTHKIKHILLAMADNDGFENIIAVIEVIKILARSKDFKYLSSITFKNQYDEKDNNRINKVYQFLMKNFHNDIHLNEVAELCNMTPNSFCRFFKMRAQKSLTQFINEIRIGHACKLLQSEDYSIADVCYASGFNNPTNFNKFFKAIKGMKPSEYRNKLNN